MKKILDAALSVLWVTAGVAFICGLVALVGEFLPKYFKR
jgi:hypothetical protein